jgi:hypothetical protein
VKNGKRHFVSTLVKRDIEAKKLTIHVEHCLTGNFKNFKNG